MLLILMLSNLHGDETIDFIKQLRLNFKNIKIIKALPATQKYNK